MSIKNIIKIRKQLVGVVKSTLIKIDGLEHGH